MSDENQTVNLGENTDLQDILTYFQEVDTLDDRREIQAKVTDIKEYKTIVFEFQSKDENIDFIVTGTKKAINTYEIDTIEAIMETESGTVRGVLDYDSGRKVINGLKMLLLDLNFDVNTSKVQIDPYFLKQ